MARLLVLSSSVMSLLLGSVVVLAAASSHTLHVQADVAGQCEIDVATGECLAGTEANDKTYKALPDTCGIYLAESTIPGAGLGIFTALPREVDDEIGYGDIMIPIIDFWYHVQGLGDKVIKAHTADYLEPTSNFVWFGPELGMQHETAHPFANTEYVLAFAPGTFSIEAFSLRLPYA
jgi:hypothetical protein